jgi:hypothetical protein
MALAPRRGAIGAITDEPGTPDRENSLKSAAEWEEFAVLAEKFSRNRRNDKRGHKLS